MGKERALAEGMSVGRRTNLIWASACLLAIATPVTADVITADANAIRVESTILEGVVPPDFVDDAFDRIHGRQDGLVKKAHRFRTVKGLFVQEDADRALAVPGQHENFGALKSWDHIHSLLAQDTKLLILVRHGEAWSNKVQAEVGDKAWKKGIGSQCSYYDRATGKTHGLFDPKLTPLGEEQAVGVNTDLRGDKHWFKTLVADFEYEVVVSPLRRCVETALRVFDKIVPPEKLHVSEYVRERMGVETCDARRAISGPHPADTAAEDGTDAVPAAGDALDKKHKKKRKQRVNCPYNKGLKAMYPDIDFPIVEGDEGFGMVADQDILWEAEYRESKDEVAERLEEFLALLFRTTTRKVVFVVLHSGSTRGVLEAVGREAYRPQNGELVPVIVQRMADTATS